MQRVRGIGGVFFKSRDPKALADWYARALGIAVEDWCGGFFPWSALDARGGAGTVWATFPADTGYFGSGPQTFMINFVVDDLDAMLAQAKAAGATVDEKVGDEPNGRFGWITDPEGHRVELWQPREPA